MNVDIKILNEELKEIGYIPKYGTEGSAGFDLVACLGKDKELFIPPNHCVMVNSGISIWIKDPNYVGIIVPRSGLGAKHGLVIGNLSGIIDSDYQGEIKIPLWNRSLVNYSVKNLDRVVQMLILPIQRVGFNIVEEFENKSDRGQNGFGSTGV